MPFYQPASKSPARKKPKFVFAEERRWCFLCMHARAWQIEQFDADEMIEQD